MSIEIGTAGTQFWKVGSRKLYAVHLSKKRNEPTRVEHIDSDGSDIEAFQTSSSEYSKPGSTLRSLVGQLDTVATDVRTIKDGMQQVLSVNEATSVPLSIVNAAIKAFRCNICLGFTRPPIITSTCCGNILGCKVCVDHWYAGEDGLMKNCPVCNRERSLPHTHRLHGLDDFLKDLKGAVQIRQQQADDGPVQSLD